MGVLCVFFLVPVTKNREVNCVKTASGSVDIKRHCYVSLVLRHGQASSPIYRFSLSDGTIVSAHTKSKLLRSLATNEAQLYMSLHILQRYASVPLPEIDKLKCMNYIASVGLLEFCFLSAFLRLTVSIVRKSSLK